MKSIQSIILLKIILFPNTITGFNAQFLKFRCKKAQLTNLGVRNHNQPSVQLIQDDDDEEYDWLPDREKARIIREQSFKRAEADFSSFVDTDEEEKISTDDDVQRREKRLTYTDEEEELISILGGKEGSSSNGKRESGFLGDSSLREISMDFQVPICYLGDVLCSWGVPPPIDPNTMLGDMVTGEQAFAILEAIHTLDVGSLNDRYAEYDLATLCTEYGIELSDGFELAMKEGWNLPFGVRTYLRVEQEDFLIDKLAQDIW